jgi:DNA-binding helix-hairpin-helix protein with protein kinase domain
MYVTFADGKTEEYENDSFASGGQGDLYRSVDRRSVIKLYHEGRTGSAREKALEVIIGKYNVTVSDPKLRQLLCYPNAIVRRPRLGVRMENVNGQTDHLQLHWWISGKSFKHLSQAMKGNWLDRVRVASNMAHAAWKLHSAGLCHSDFSSSNFLANVAMQRVVLIDLDSLVVPGELPPEMLGTGDYMAPEIVIAHQKKDGSAKPTIDTDKHALAVLIYQLLLMRHPLRGPLSHNEDSQEDDMLAFGEKALYIEDPEDTRNRPQGAFNGSWLLGEEMEGLFRRAFTIGLRDANKRPAGTDWDTALTRMTDQIIPCGNPQCVGNAFVLLKDQPAVCPWCGQAIQFPQQVPILRLYNTSRMGHFMPDKGRIVGWQGRPLNRWHVSPNFSERKAISAEDRSPLAEMSFDRQSKRWVLTNKAIEYLRIAGAGQVQQAKPGQSMVIEDGQQWLLGKGESARMVVVNMQRLQKG